MCLSSTFQRRTLSERSSAVAESMDALIEGAGEAPNPVYARLRNPTVAGFENALADLESAEAAVAFASGMAAITAMVLAAGSEAAPDGWARGRHIVAIRPIYGGTDHLLATGILGTEVTWAEPDEVAESLREDTCLVLLETPANPTLAMVDIAGVVSQVRATEKRFGYRIAVAVDNTFATPILQRPLELGADLVVTQRHKIPWRSWGRDGWCGSEFGRLGEAASADPHDHGRRTASVGRISPPPGASDSPGPRRCTADVRRHHRCETGWAPGSYRGPLPGFER